MRGASAFVESVFSGVKRLLRDFAATMSPELLELYVFIHYNWAYDFMRPTIDEIVKAYLEVYGPEEREEDVDESDGEEDEDGEDGDRSHSWGWGSSSTSRMRMCTRSRTSSRTHVLTLRFAQARHLTQTRHWISGARCTLEISGTYQTCRLSVMRCSYTVLRFISLTFDVMYAGLRFGAAEYCEGTGDG